MMMDDDGNEVQEGQPGEMFIRGPQVMLRYWKNEAATKESLDADGWLKTGDIAIMKQGWFWIVDRKKVSKRGLAFRPVTHTFDRSSSKSTHCKSLPQNLRLSFWRTMTLQMQPWLVSPCMAKNGQGRMSHSKITQRDR